MSDENKLFVDTLDELRGVWEEELKPHIKSYGDRIAALEVANGKKDLGDTVVEQRGPFLGLEQKAAPHFGSSADFEADLRFGAMLAALISPDAAKQLNESETKALSTLTGPAGDYLVPEVVASMFIDSIRPKTRVLQAGARTLPMSAPTVKIPGWDTPVPAATWVGEGTSFADAGGAFRQVILSAKAVGAYVTLSNELFEDAGSNLDAVDSIVINELAKAIAQALDYAALFGSGAGAQPQGLASVAADGTVTAISGVTQLANTGTNGAATNVTLSGTNNPWEWFIDLVATVRLANFEPSATLWSPRTPQSLAKVKLATTFDAVRRPDYLAGHTFLDTTQIGTTYKKGTSTDTSVAFCGDWSQLVVGFRPEAGVRIARDPYSKARSRQVDVVVWHRADIGVLNPSAFALLDGIRP